MKSAALQHLESLLVARKLARTIPALDGQQASAVVPSGLSVIDRQLGGGWRQGEISELIGPRSAGRTTALVSTLRGATLHGAVVALVDTVDRFDPGAAARAGLDLGRVLWVRGPAIGVETARPSLVEDAVVKALRAFDLLLRAGGFAVVALDLADVPARHVRSLPQTTWLRLAHANEGRTSVGLLIGDGPMGRSARGATIRVHGTPHWAGQSPQRSRLLGVRYREIVNRDIGISGNRDIGNRDIANREIDIPAI